MYILPIHFFKVSELQKLMTCSVIDWFYYSTTQTE